MNRRTFVTGLGAALAAPIAAEAQRGPELKAANIGFLFGGTPSSPSVQIGPFKQTLHDKGWTEGRLPALGRELVNHGVNLIVTDG